MEKLYIPGKDTLLNNLYTPTELLDHVHSDMQKKYADLVIDLSNDLNTNWSEKEFDGAHQNIYYYFSHPSASLCHFDKNEWLMVRGLCFNNFPIKNTITWYSLKEKLMSLPKQKMTKNITKIIRGEKNIMRK